LSEFPLKTIALTISKHYSAITSMKQNELNKYTSK